MNFVNASEFRYSKINLPSVNHKLILSVTVGRIGFLRFKPLIMILKFYLFIVIQQYFEITCKKSYD